MRPLALVLVLPGARVRGDHLRAKSAVPYVVLGCGYAAIAISLLIIGASRQRKLQRTLATNKPAPVSFALVAAFTLAGALLALMTAVLVLAQV